MDEHGTNAVWATTDDELFAELRRVIAEVDPVPDTVLAAARAAITTRDLDSELAVLVADSACPRPTAPSFSSPPFSSPAFEPVRTGMADAAGGRLLSFAGGGVQLEMEVTAQGELVDLIGQLIGGSADECVLEYAHGWRAVPLDGLGRFIVSGIRRGPVRVRCRSAPGAPVTTSWVAI